MLISIILQTNDLFPPASHNLVRHSRLSLRLIIFALGSDRPRTMILCRASTEKCVDVIGSKYACAACGGHRFGNCADRLQLTHVSADTCYTSCTVAVRIELSNSCFIVGPDGLLITSKCRSCTSRLVSKRGFFFLTNDSPSSMMTGHL